MPGKPSSTDFALPWSEAIERLPLPVAVVGGRRDIVFANAAWRALASGGLWPGPGQTIDGFPSMKAANPVLCAVLAGTFDHGEGGDAGSREAGWFTWHVRTIADSLALVVLSESEKSRRVDAAALEFLQGLTHEIGSPMQAVTGFSELVNTRLDTTPEAPVRRDYLKTIDQAARDAVVMLNARLELATALFGAEREMERPVHLGTLMRAAVEAVRGEANRVGVEILVEPDADPLATCAENGVWQSLIAILTDAINASQRDCSVGMSIREAQEGRYALCVSDQGIPVASAELERFRCSATGTRLRQGLRLALARALMRRQNGDVTADGGAEGGLIVRLWLPASESFDEMT